MGPNIFISSCSRRQLARRRHARSAVPLQLILLLVIIAAGLAAFVAGRGGL
jgi:hypothetical protein